MQRNGVRVQLGEKVLEVANVVRTDKGVYPADLVLIATGFKPNTEFNTNLKLSKEGAIVIDDQCRTNLPDIYAAGDCATVSRQSCKIRFWTKTTPSSPDPATSQQVLV